MSDTLTRYRLQNSLGFQLSITARQQERRLDEAFRDLGLTRTTWCILLAVENEGLTRPSEIADFLGVDRTAISRSLRQMEKHDIIQRKSGQTDRRTTSVGATAKGREVLARGTPMAEDNARLVTKHLSDDDVAALFHLLNKLRGPNALNLDRI